MQRTVLVEVDSTPSPNDLTKLTSAQNTWISDMKMSLLGSIIKKILSQIRHDESVKN